MSVRVTIDRDLCIGSGTCTRLAPGAFALDDDEIATVLDPERVDLAKLRLAAEGCPTEAISVIEGDDHHDD
jgi:ferredoxin